jgi:hypothetical protein
VMRRFSSKSDPVVEVEVEMVMDKAPEVDIKPIKAEDGGVHQFGGGSRDVSNGWPGICACA